MNKNPDETCPAELDCAVLEMELVLRKYNLVGAVIAVAPNGYRRKICFQARGMCIEVIEERGIVIDPARGDRVRPTIAEQKLKLGASLARVVLLARAAQDVAEYATVVARLTSDALAKGGLRVDLQETIEGHDAPRVPPENPIS